MQLTPRYDGPVVLDVVYDGDPSVPLLRQRRRLAATLATLTDRQWDAPTRCEGWTVKDVVSHLVGTDGFWTIAFAAGMRGEPTKFLATFDPVATPARMVDGTRSLTPSDVLAQFQERLASLEDLINGVEASQWSVRAEAPPGHLELRVAALHALWDAWIHERDIVIPLGITPVEESDEIELVLRYAVGLSPAFCANAGSNNVGTLTIETTDPKLSLLVEAGPSVRVADGFAPTGAHLTGRAVDLIEALSARAELEHDLRPEHLWLFEGLKQVFDQAGA